MEKHTSLTLLSQRKLALTTKIAQFLRYTINGATKKLKKPRPLLRPRTNRTCHQKPNPSRETVPLNNILTSGRCAWDTRWGRAQPPSCASSSGESSQPLPASLSRHQGASLGTASRGGRTEKEIRTRKMEERRNDIKKERRRKL